MRIFDLGLIAYADARTMQEQALRRVLDSGEESLFLLEHPPVITFGRNGGEENLHFDRSFFAARGVDIVASTRGGNITCHFPGQFVAYPIMRVDKRPGGLRRFFADLEEAVIRTLARFGLAAARMDNRPGVWVRDRKICSIGIAVKHWVTSHGLSLNVARDLSLFDLVTPCGLPGVQATSLHRELDDDSVDMAAVKAAFLHEFRELFPSGKTASPTRNAKGADAPQTVDKARFAPKMPGQGLASPCGARGKAPLSPVGFDNTCFVNSL